MPWFQDKLGQTWIWIKDRWVTIGLALALLGGSAVALILQEDPTLIGNPTLVINGKMIEFTYTDDNTDEDLIIHTTQKDYWNFAGSITVYYTIKNISNDNQWVEAVFSFGDDTGNKKYIADISEYDGEETVEIEEFIPTEILTATSTDIILVSSISEKAVTKWKTTPLQTFTAPVISNRKDVKGMTGLKGHLVFINAGEIRFFKAKIKYLSNTDREEFFIEAFGDKGAYGHLDPDILTESFDSYSDGDLTDQSAWVDSSNGGIVVQGTEVKHGAKAAYATNLNERNAYIDFTGETSGTQVFYARSSIATAKAGIQLVESGSAKVYFVFQTDGNIKYYNGAAYITIQAYSANTWYKFEVEWDAARGGGGEARYRIDDGAWTGWDSVAGTFTQIDRLLLYGSGGGGNMWWDSFGYVEAVAVIEKLTPPVIGLQ